MATSFPAALDNFTNPTSSDSLDTPGVFHDVQHANLNDAVEALEAKVGIDGSSNTGSLDYRIKQESLITSPASGTVPSTVKGATGQTANLQNWKNSAGTVLAAFTASGKLSLVNGGTGLQLGSTTDLLIDNAATPGGRVSFTASGAQLGTSSTSYPLAVYGAVSASATASKFGTGANSASGAYIEIGDAGDSTNTYVISKGSAADIGAVWKTKGSGNFQLQSGAGATLISVDSAGGMRCIGAGSRFGEGANGASGTFLEFGSLSDALNTWLVAKGSGADVGISMSTKGNGAFVFYAGGSSQHMAVIPNQGVAIGSSVNMGNSQKGVLGLSDIPAALSGSPTSGGYLYVDSGALKYRGSAGTVTTLAPA